jgi:hypothetical protein
MKTVLPEMEEKERQNIEKRKTMVKTKAMVKT